METVSHQNRFVAWGDRFFPLALAFALPWPVRIFSPMAGICILYFLVRYITARQFDTGFLKTIFFKLLALSFVILVAGLFYTSDLRQGLRELERNIVIVIFPVLIYQWRRSDIRVADVSMAFTAGVLAITLFGFVYCLFFVDPVLRERAFEQGHSYYSELILLHPTYLSVFFCFIFFFLLEYFRKNRHLWSTVKRTIMVLAMLYVMGMIIFLRVRISVGIIGMSAVGYGLLLIRTKRRRLVIAGVVAVVSLVALIGTARLTEWIYKYGRNPAIAVDNRLAVWQAAFEGYKFSPVFGAGTGGAQNLIDEGYLKTGYDFGMDQAFNAHNQFLQFLCRNGIPELAVFLALLFICWRSALRDNAVAFLAFLTAMTLSMVTESMLYVQKGIIFFYFFACAFFFLKHE